MNPIVAATSDAVRRELVELARNANIGVHAVALEPMALEHLLQLDRGASVITGGTLTHVRPFLNITRKANAPVVAVLIGGLDPEDRWDLDYGGLGVLRAMPRADTLQAAVIASTAGLSVWDPDLSTATDLDANLE